MAAAINVRKQYFDRPICKYGLSCYQKNPNHHKKFKHPSADKGHTVKNVNMNYFNGDKNTDISGKDIADTAATTTLEMPVVSEELVDSSNKETVDQILKSLPKDFFDFWDFCSVIKSSPEDAFSEFGFKLVGPYDLLAKQLPKDAKVDMSCHWRYFYDPPEFQTVIVKDGKEMYHIGYFRDDPLEMPSILASNSASVDANLTLMGDNIFAAMNIEFEKTIKMQKPKVKILEKLQKQLQEYASQKKYTLAAQTVKTKQRQKKVVAKTFHGLGIVVPFENDIGYRPLPDSNTKLKEILKKIVSAKNQAKRLDCEEDLDEIMTNVHFANDECDYGMGLELGIDLFCYGHTYFHSRILSLLSVAYKLLQRPKYASIITAHLRDRKKDSPLLTLNV